MNVKHIILLLSIALLTACSENEKMESKQQPIPDNTDNLVPVQFSVSGLHSIDFTRASASIVTFNSGETIKVFVKPNGADDYEDYDYTTASSGQSNIPLTPPATPPYYPPGPSTTVDAYAYYPSTAGTTFTVQDDQTSDGNYKASDLMYAVNRTITKGISGNDNLSMEHLMAQLAITAQAQTGSGLDIKAVEVQALKSVTFAPAPDAANRVTATGSAGTITALNAAGTGYIVIPPQVIAGVVVRVITGNRTADETATYAFTGTTGNFQSGASYGINLTVSPDQLGLTSSINNWNGLGSVNVTPSGNLSISAISAQEYTGSEITPGFTVFRDGAVFPTANYNVQWVNNVVSGTAYVIVTGKNMGSGADYSTCIGMASFTITPANGKIGYDITSLTKTYGNEPFVNPLTNYDKRPGHEGQNADGEVTYESSVPSVATVDEITGEVTILKSGTTNIIATATNGANYVYSTTEDDNTASYELTVNKAAGNISFGYPSPSQTWSPTTSNNKYTQTATITGDATATYSIGSTNTCGASINATTGEVTFTQSGDVQIIATVTDTERYKYATKSVSYSLHVNKAVGSISFANLTPRKTYSLTSASNTFTQTVTNTGDATVTYSVPATNNSYNTCGATINSSTGVVSFTKPGIVQVTASVSDNYKYTYPTSSVTYILTVNSSMATISSNDVGQILANDGVVYSTVTAATEAGATPSGIIAYVGTAGSVDTSSSTYKCLVISLDDANTLDSRVQWNFVGSNGDMDPNTGTCVSQNEDLATVLGYKNGIACTTTLYNSNGTGVTSTCKNHNHPPARLARNYSTVRPSGTSEWFLASMGQWNLILKGLATKEAGSNVNTDLTLQNNSTYIPSQGINTVITAAGASGLQDAFYASSTECRPREVWDVYLLYGRASINTKGGSYLVRPIFAF